MFIGKLAAWVKPSFEGEDGRSSYRRLSAFYAICMDAYIILFDKINTPIMEHIHYSLLVYSLLMTGIVTAGNIIAFKNGSKNEKVSESNIEFTQVSKLGETERQNGSYGSTGK